MLGICLISDGPVSRLLLVVLIHQNLKPTAPSIGTKKVLICSVAIAFVPEGYTHVGFLLPNLTGAQRGTK